MGSSHSECNKHFYYQKRLNVFFHNLRGYDGHFLVDAIGKFNKKISIISTNNEKFISIGIGKVIFKDSFQFMGKSLADLTENLVKSESDKLKLFNYLSSEFKGKQLELLKRKGIFPYEYLDSFDRFKETALPEKEKFYSRLNNTNFSDKDYEHALNVWKTFNMKTFGDYHDIYLKTDVLLLADIFENFRKLCLNYYRLDPCHYYGTPGISWDACLKMSGEMIELVTDSNIYLFLEHAKKGGMSFIGHRLAEANNKYMKDFDLKKESSYLMYFDANSLYSWAICNPLPIGRFKWVISRNNNKFINTMLSEKM